jgi:phosphoglycerate dehydrogenase-like enzyme
VSSLTPPSTPVATGVGTGAWEVLSRRAPEGAELIAVNDDTELSVLQTVDFLIINGGARGVIRQLPQMPDLRVVQALSAGTDSIEPLLPPRATLCNARGGRDSAVAEWLLAALLGAGSRIVERARATVWPPRLELRDLSDQTVLVVGMGSIGRELERIIAPIGASIVGVASRARADLHGVDELPQLLPEADAVVVLAPLSDATRGLIGAEAMAAMRDGTLIVNAARGAVVDTDALVAETRSGRLHAILDVTDPEPLPDGHPLWSCPGVLSITPHIAGDSPRAGRQAAELAADQLERYLAGEPLINVVREGGEAP